MEIAAPLMEIEQLSLGWLVLQLLSVVSSWLAFALGA